MNRFIQEVGPMNVDAPSYPLAAVAVDPLRKKAESNASGEFSPLWAGQAAALAREEQAGRLTQRLASQALDILHRL